jgi:hypothetical protein
MQGLLARKWCSRFQPKEIKSFPQLMKRFQKDWIPGYEEVEYVQVFIDLQGKMLEKDDHLVIEYGEHRSHDTLMEIKEKMDAVNFLTEFIRTNYHEPHIQQLANDLLELCPNRE